MAKAPRVRITTRGVRPEGDAWIIRWTVANEGDELLRITRAMAPHGRFRADGPTIAGDIAPGGEGEIALLIRVDHSGDEVENAFLILEARYGAADWRILARLRVRTADGMPQPRTERIDVQEVGFSGGG